jgi:hypothetical protein
MIWQTLHYKGNPEFEYQKRGNTWVKRKIGSGENWYPVVPQSIDILNAYFKKNRGIGYQYSTIVKTGAIVITIFGIYLITTKWNLKK